MPLTLVLGPANSAKAGEVLSAYAAAAHHGALLVVPTAADAEYYGRRLAGQGAVLGSVLTFSGLAREIAHRTGYAARRLSPLQRERVLRRTVARTRLEVLSESAASHGFAAAVGTFIAELARSLVSPQRLTEALERWAAADTRQGPYARDVAALYRAYADELERIHRVDRDLFAWRAIDRLRSAPQAWGEDRVFFYGFDDLTPLERDAVETLARVVGIEVTVSLSYEAGRAAFAARAEAVEELRPLAARVLELPALEEHYAPDSRAALHHLERHLFEPPPERVEPGDAIRLLEAGGMRAEAELVAAEVLALLRSGVPGEEIVVLERTLTGMAPVLERVFALYGIPAASQRRVRLAHTGLGRGILALARCAWVASAPAGELVAYLRTPGLLERPEIADRLELEVGRGAVPSADRARELVSWSLGEIDSLREASNPAAELGWQARRLFAAPFRGRAPELAAGAELDARALAELLRALGELEELGERPSGPQLIELMDEIEVRAGELERAGSVLIADPLGVRARRFRVVFVCGLQEGGFPVPGAPEPFLSDERRREVAAASGLALPASEDSVARERYLFYACLSRATEQVVLSYRSSDEEGNLELPSPFLSDVEDLLAAGWAERRRKRLLADVVWARDLAPTSSELERSLAAGQAPVAGEAPAPDRVLHQAALSHVRHREVVSAGALEAFARCPVRWLVERELAPAEFEPDPDALTRGSYMHDVLERLLGRLGGPVTQTSLPRAQELLGELLADSPPAIAPGRPEAVRAGMLRSIEADLRRYLVHEAADGCGWAPQGLELRFGFAQDDEDRPSLPALTLRDGDDQISVRGLIDRVDVEPGDSGRAAVRDYKSGGARNEHQGARWALDDQLQVALYMLAVRELLGLSPVAGLYQPLGGNDLRARGVFLEDAPVGAKVVDRDSRSPEELEEVLSAARERAVALAVQLRSGELEPSPQSCSRDGCRYPGICRSQ